MPNDSHQNHARLSRPARRHRSAFTLIEVLVVMGIIVLLIALALPAFNYITGSRSVESAGNLISSSLGVARARAIGLQRVCGVMFFIEPSSDHVQLGLVEETSRPSGGTAPNDPDANTVVLTSANAIDVYLDLVDATEFVKLPVGISVQTVTNAIPTVTTPAYPPGATERYVGFNGTAVDYAGTTPNFGWTSANTASPALQTQVGGVILFDANGQITAKTYALRTRRVISGVYNATTMGQLLTFNFTDPTQTSHPANLFADYIPANALTNSVTFSTVTVNVSRAPVSQLGLVMFDRAAFDAQNFRPGDNTRVNGGPYDATTVAGEGLKEAWLDEQGTPVMINRYNGTLVRGE